MWYLAASMLACDAKNMVERQDLKSLASGRAYFGVGGRRRQDVQYW